MYWVLLFGSMIEIAFLDNSCTHPPVHHLSECIVWPVTIKISGFKMLTPRQVLYREIKMMGAHNRRSSL
jgi:hypothetical protein